MNLQLIPQPQKVQTGSGSYALPLRPGIGIPGHEWTRVSKALTAILPCATVQATSPNSTYDVQIVNDGKQSAEGYRLQISKTNIQIQAAEPRGAFWGVMTLRQILEQCEGGKLPLVTITDAPSLADRGYYYDVARGRVPKRNRLLEMADLLSAYKINHLELYIEHTFAFRGHPSIGKDASPLTADDILALDAHCQQRYVELVPSLATFGHLATVLKHPEYHHLAEDYGVNKYKAKDTPSWLTGWSLAPANPKTYSFLDSLFAEFLPLFSSKRFNVCCDETWDIGCGQSYDLAQKIGLGNLYVGHLLKLYELCGKYGKQMMFWGDIIRKYPELLKKLPKDAVVLDWGYGYDHNFEAIRDFQKSGMPFMACPATSSYFAFFPRIPQARANIAGFAAAAKKSGAQGVLCTEWGDGGHYNFLECSWSEIAFNAEQCWNTDADQKSFSERFCGQFLNIPAAKCKKVAQALDQLGRVSFTAATGYYQSILRHTFFATADDKLFQGETQEIDEFTNGKFKKTKKKLNATLGQRLEKEAEAVIRELTNWLKVSVCDPHGVLPYWIFAAECMSFAARKITLLTGKSNTPAERKKLATEQKALLKRFQILWKARNEHSEIEITLKMYQKSIQSLQK